MSEHEKSSRKSQVAVRSITFWQEKFQRSRYFGQRTLRKFSKIMEKVWKLWTGVNVSKTKLQEKQWRSRRISEIAEDVMPADCGSDFEGILSPQSPAITARNTQTRNGVIGGQYRRLYRNPHREWRKLKGARKCQWHPPRPQQDDRISTRNVHRPETRLWSHNMFQPGTLGT